MVWQSAGLAEPVTCQSTCQTEQPKKKGDGNEGEIQVHPMQCNAMVFTYLPFSFTCQD